MTFYIAERNKETGKFELRYSDNKVEEIHDEAKASDESGSMIKIAHE